VSTYAVTLDLKGIEADSHLEAEAWAMKLLNHLGKEYDIWDVWCTDPEETTE
jgi:hypothetical protein